MQAKANSPTLIWIGYLETHDLGKLWVGETDGGLASVFFSGEEEDYLRSFPKNRTWAVDHHPERCLEALTQIGEYLEGKRKAFDLRIDWSVMGTFQRQALEATCKIPYGQTRTYGWLAESIGHSGAARAVGRAEATNPMPIIIPCHRVLGSDGSLHGYGAGTGLATKRWLLDLEKGGSPVQTTFL